MMTMETIEYYVLNYGYITIFLSLILGLVGLPIPDEVLMPVIGYYSKTSEIQFHWALIVAVIGTVCGMSISYCIGKFVGDKALKGFMKWLGINQKKLDRVEM